MLSMRLHIEETIDEGFRFLRMRLDLRGRFALQLGFALDREARRHSVQFSTYFSDLR